MMFVSPDAGTMDDSMLDVDGRADVLDSLVQRVTDEQADTVGRVLSGEVGSENGLDLAGQGVSTAMVSREAEGSGDVISLMRRQMSVMEQLIKGSVAGLDGQDDSSGGSRGRWRSFPTILRNRSTSTSCIKWMMMPTIRWTRSCNSDYVQLMRTQRLIGSAELSIGWTLLFWVPQSFSSISCRAR